MNAVTVEDWISKYMQAWREADSDLVSQLFTDDGVYCFNLFHEPARGRDGIRAYWRGVTATQSDVEVRLGNPILVDSRAIVEFWTNMKESGEDVTLTGCMLLTFSHEGLCSELREYWIVQDGTKPPPPVWGT